MGPVCRLCETDYFHTAKGDCVKCGESSIAESATPVIVVLLGIFTIVVGMYATVEKLLHPNPNATTF